jgi:hypothetical protein
MGAISSRAIAAAKQAVTDALNTVKTATDAATQAVQGAQTAASQALTALQAAFSAAADTTAAAGASSARRRHGSPALSTSFCSTVSAARGDPSDSSSEKSAT